MFSYSSGFASVVLLCSTVFLAACGGGGGDDDVPVTMTLTASAVSPTAVHLAWTPAGKVPSAYVVNMDGSKLGLVHSSTSVTPGGLEPSTRYCFQIFASYFPFGALESSNTACATTFVDLPPTTPTNLSANVISPGQIELTWNAAADDYDVRGYRLYRDGAVIATVGGTTASDDNLVPSTQYCYRVSAYDAVDNESAKSSQVCATTPDDTTPPSAPQRLVAQAVSNTEIQLSWSPSTDDGVVRGYRLFRDGTFLQDTTNTQFADTSAGPATQYCYHAIAYDAAGNQSELSNRTCVTTSWTITVVDDKVDVQWTAIALDSLDSAHISYYDGKYVGANQQTGELKYAENTSGFWTTRLIDGVGSIVEASTSIAVDLADAVHIGYYVFGAWDVKHATNATGAWTSEIVADALNVESISLALDSGGRIHLVYDDTGDLIYATNAEGMWTTEVVGNIGASFGHTRVAAIALDTSDAVHIGYYHYPTRDLRYLTNAAGPWSTQTVDSEGDIGSHVAIAVDSAGRAYLSYYDATNGDLKYASNASGIWSTQTVDGLGDVGTGTAIDLSNAGTVHISYTDDTNHDLKYATNSSGAWRTYVIDSAMVSGIFSAPGGYTGIAVDSLDKVHISYRGNTLLRYATNR